MNPLLRFSLRLDMLAIVPLRSPQNREPEPGQNHRCRHHGSCGRGRWGVEAGEFVPLAANSFGDGQVLVEGGCSA